MEKQKTSDGEIDSAQEGFLKLACAQAIPVTLFLINGVKLQGEIAGFDNFSIVLQRASQTQLVYKHAIATIVPGLPLPEGKL